MQFLCYLYAIAMEDIIAEEIDFEKVKYFVASLRNTIWMLSANERTIDVAFNCSVEIQESFLQEERKKFNEKLVNEYPEIDFKKSVELLMETFLKSSHLTDHLTLYAVKKYITYYSKADFCKILENALVEVELRQSLFKFIEESCESNLGLNWQNINTLLHELNTVDKTELNYKILNALKSKTSVLLNAVKHGSVISGQNLIDKIIHCLEAQSDLRLWFLLMKPENLEVALDLCVSYRNFLNAVLNFFDKFADEIESNYDEDLSLKYCHVNLDFDDFVTVFKSFINRKGINKVIDDYLERKTMLTDKNFVFWIDIKACI